jgi:hypothetical protein
VTDSASDPHEYELVVRGHLDQRWADSLPGLQFTRGLDPDGEPVTVLRGPVVDESELHGLMARIRDRGVTLISMRQMPEGADQATRPASQTPEEQR